MVEHRAFPKSVQAGIPKLGPKPTGWKSYALGDLLTVVERPIRLDSEQQYQLVTARRNRGGIVERGRLTGRSIKTKTQFLTRSGDFLISRRQIAHGACGIVPSFLDEAVVSNEYATLQPTNLLNIDFLKHLTNTIYFQQTCFHSSIGVHVEKLVFNLEHWMTWQFHLPPLPDQHRIATILDEWDNAIATSEKLAKAKLVRKDGLARKLLDLCLVDHAPQGWVTALLGDLFEERTTVGGSERLLAVTAGQGIIDRDETGRKDTSADDKSSYKLIEPGDIGYNTMRMWQGVSALSSLRGLVSPAYTIVRPNADIDAQFAAQLFKYNHMIHTFWRYSQGLVDDTLMLKFPQFSEIKINIPPLDVQRETGEILSGADLEVGQLQDLRNQLRMQKRGLMQKLLSGDWPVPASIDRLLPGGQDIDEGVEAEEQRAEATG